MVEVKTIPAGYGYGVRAIIQLSEREQIIIERHGPNNSRFETLILGESGPVLLTPEGRDLLIGLLSAESLGHNQRERIAALVPTDKIDAQSEYDALQRHLATQ